MKYAKSYIALGAVVLVALLIKLNMWDVSYGQVEAFRGANLEEQIFFPMMANSINEENGISLVINDEESKATAQEVVLGSNLQPYLSSDFIKSQFNVSARVYNKNSLKIIYNGQTKSFSLKDDAFFSNDKFYISLDELKGFLDFSYDWNSTEYILTMDINTSSSKLPSQFDLRDISCTSKIRNQGSGSTCWAYAATGALESSILPEKVSFDVEDMINNNSFGLSESDGGDFTMALAYLLSWQGPKTDNSGDTNTVTQHVQSVDFYTSEDLEDIKWAVYKYGGVSTSIYANVSTGNLNKSTYYNKKTNSYCYQGDNQPNHEIIIVGWDDNYSASNFSDSVKGNGAFICQNSWGTSFGDNGIFYVSYYDSVIGSQAVSYKLIDSNSYDVVHQTDLCGYVGKVGFSSTKIFGANVYTCDSKEKIKAAGFYTLEDNVKYNLYIVEDYKNTDDLNERQLVSSGTVKNAGYNTIEFNKYYTMTKGQKFAVVLELTSSTSTKPLAIEYKASDRTQNVKLDDGDGYLSSDGINWKDSLDSVQGNICLKVYGSSIEE